MNHYSVIAFESNRFVEIRRRILEAEPDLDERTLHDTLEGATNLNEAIAEIVRSALDDAALTDALKVRINELKERLGRIEARIAAKREIARSTMEEIGIDRVVEADCTISLRTCPPSLLIVDEALIPEWYWVPQPSKLNKRSLLDTIKSGDLVPGAALADHHTTLSVRTR